MSKQSGVAGVGVVITGRILEPGILGGFFDGFKESQRQRPSSERRGEFGCPCISIRIGPEQALLSPLLLLLGTAPLLPLLPLETSTSPPHFPLNLHQSAPELVRPCCARPKHQRMSLKWVPRPDRLCSLSERSIVNSAAKAAFIRMKAWIFRRHTGLGKASCDVNPLDGIR
jgi:hypothetical protein